MKLSRFILAGLILFCACKKSGKKEDQYDSNVRPYFKDIIINEKLADGNHSSQQRALGYFPLKSDPNTQIMVASRGSEESYDARGFRIASINKTNGTVNWVKSYDLDDKYFIQIATCATMDKAGNIWVGGHSFQHPDPASLFLAKFDPSGNLLWSKSFSNYMALRAYSLTSLSNGDIAFLAKNSAVLAVHRLNADGQPVWSTEISYFYTSTIDDDYYTGLTEPFTPENHALVETTDGSIYFATSSNPSNLTFGGSDRLYRLDANGKLQFAKIYTLDNNTGRVRPVQLINAGADKLLMADQVRGPGQFSVGSCPYFSLLSLDGEVLASRGRPLDLVNEPGLNMNEVNCYDNNIYFSICGNREFNTYVLDLSLTLKSAVKTAAATDIGTDAGGISLFDETDRALYYVLNFGGGSPESNGFEVVRNDAVGKPCVTTYTIPPTTLLLENTHIITTSDTTITNVGYGPVPVLAPLTWRQYQVSVAATENVCGQ